jgi:hypothetical protein
MSAFVINRQTDGVVILTDGALCTKSDDYKLSSLLSKIWPMPHISTVVCYVGSVNVFSLLVLNHGPEWASFDYMLEVLPRDLEYAATQALSYWPGAGTAVMIAVAGWSDARNRWESYSIGVGGSLPEDEWFVVHPLHPLTYMPSITDEADAIARERANGNGLQYLREIMEQQRLQKLESANGPERGAVFSVGGFIQETYLTKECITTKIAKHWPDAVGFHINPVQADAC